MMWLVAVFFLLADIALRLYALVQTDRLKKYVEALHASTAITLSNNIADTCSEVANLIVQATIAAQYAERDDEKMN